MKKQLLFAFLLIPLMLQAARGEVTRYFAGNPEDVKPALHGPAFHFQGGGDDVDAAFQWMFDQVRGCSDCDTRLDVVVLRATGDGDYNDYLLAMKGVDSVETLVITSREDSTRADVVEAIRNAEVVFFAGGDQCNYVRNFKGTPVQTAVESVYARGGGIGGTSAGDAIQGQYVYDACKSENGTLASEALGNPYHEGITFTGDFLHWKYMEGTMTDQHIVERDRIGRTFAFLARQIQDGTTDRILGLAADRQTSILIDRNGLATISGKGPAYFILADHRPEVCHPGKPLTYSNFKIWKLDPGQAFDLKNRPTTGYYTRSVKNGIIEENPYAVLPCEPSAEIRNAIAAAKNIKDLAASYPDNVFVLRAYLDSLEPAAAVEAGRKLLEQKPADPRRLYLVAHSLLREGPSEPAIGMLKDAIHSDPEFPLPYLELASAYSAGDTSKVKATLQEAIRMCPRELTVYPLVLSTGDSSFITVRAAELRRFLRYASQAQQVQYLPTLWQMEFAVTPAKEQGALLDQIREDLSDLLPAKEKQ